MQLASLRHDFLGLPDRPSGDGGVHDLIQGDDCDPPPQLAALEQGLARLLVVGDDEEEAPAGADLKRPVVRLKFGVDVEELGHDTLHGTAVEAPVGIGVVEIHSTEVCPQGVQALLELVVRGLALPGSLDELLVGLGVELQLLELRTLLVDEVLGDGLLLEQPLAVLLALRQGLLHRADALLQARDAHGLLLLVGLHLREPRLRRQELLAQGLALALALGRGLRRHAGGERLHGPLGLLDVLLDLVLLLSQLIELGLFLLEGLLLRLHLLLEVAEGRLGLLSRVQEGLEVRLAVLQFRLRCCDFLGLLRVLLLKLLQLVRPLLVPGCCLLLDLIVDLQLAIVKCFDGTDELLQRFLHLVDLLVLVLKPVLHLHILVGDAEPLQALDLVVVGDPEHVVCTLPLQLLQRRCDLL
mmetsp:Transcript_125776/g.305550  ORF Transcript_125776/g.305550 Transcript_125776/m.305550 type:complete len:412 (+) Transcript_125776:2038-3273(+)